MVLFSLSISNSKQAAKNASNKKATRFQMKITETRAKWKLQRNSTSATFLWMLSYFDIVAFEIAQTN